MRKWLYMVSWFVVCVWGASAEVIIQDDFSGLADGQSVSLSTLEVGDGTWSGSMVSDGSGNMRIADPSAPNPIEAIGISLPDFGYGDVVTVKARVAYGSGAAWLGIGFANSNNVHGTMADYTPWTLVYPGSGRVALFGGAATANAGDSTYRTTGVTNAVFDLEITYDLTAKVVTVTVDGETVMDYRPIVTSGVPTLDYAFVNFYRSGAAVPFVDTYVESFEVSVEESDKAYLVIDDFSGLTNGAAVSESILEAGSGVWEGTMVSDGAGKLEVTTPSTPPVMAGVAVELPEFSNGDIITIVANVGCVSGYGWIGVGFSNSNSAPTSMSTLTPWGIYRPFIGRVTACGGPGVANYVANYSATSNDVSGTVVELKFIYDTGAGTITTYQGGEIVNDHVAVTPGGTPELKYAFVNFYRAGATTPYVDVTVNSLVVYKTNASGVGTQDIDADGMSDEWEVSYFGSLSAADPAAMASNGINTLLEAYIAGLDPTDSAARFMATGVGPLQWNAVSGRVYNIYWTSDLQSEFQLLEENVSSGVFSNSVADPQGFYRIEALLAP